MTSTQRRFYWRLCYGSAFVLSVLTFTPLVIPAGVYTPIVLGLPYTLWMGILITVALVLLTFLAGRVYPHDPSDGGRAPSQKTSTDS
jgi:hypothetical protein